MNTQILKEGALLQGGKYRIVKVLGQGGFGITYLAKQKVSIVGPLGNISAEIEVAIKEFFIKDFCVRQGDGATVSITATGGTELVTKFKQKFIKEAQNISKLSHPNIIKVLDVFEENATAYYVMEYINAGSLNDLVKSKGMLSEDETLAYIKKIAGALQYIHSMRMNHLDIKPANVLLRQDGDVVLIDFGLSKNYDVCGEQTTTTPIGVSVGYAPLEQLRIGGLGSFSPATDIYALGATMYKLLTGQTPPDAGAIFDEGLPNLPSTVSVNLRNVITKSMEPRKKDRYQDMDEFLGCLDNPASSTKTEPDCASEDTQVILPHMQPNLEETPEPKFLNEEDKEATVIISDMMVKKSSIATEDVVDLGLSVKWCSHNLGASNPGEFGTYLPWGTNIKNFTTMSDDIDGTEFDEVYRLSNGNWRTPTRKHFKELIDKCRWSWTEYNGVIGCKVTGPSGKSIFLPAAGKLNNLKPFCLNSIGYYWSATKSHMYNTAYYLYFNSEDSELAYEPIATLRSIRPICD